MAQGMFPNNLQPFRHPPNSLQDSESSLPRSETSVTGPTGHHPKSHEFSPQLNIPLI